jgi:hypothetical protein
MELPGSKENYYLGGMLGLITFAAIFIFGLFSGVSLVLLFLRGILFGLLVSSLGIAAGFFLERLVPGLWDDGSSLSGRLAGDESDQDSSYEQSADEPNSSFEYTVGDDSLSSGPLPDGSEDLGSPVAPAGRESRSVTGDSKVVGNFRIIGDKQFPNDPEDYAKAIRTMMSRDED